MRRWRTASAVALAAVADRPATWLAGALAWLVTIGWISFVAGVARPPSVSDLTFLGARIFTSGLWPWNAFGIGIAILGVVGIGFVIVAVAEGSLLDQLGPRRRGWAGAARLLGIAVLTAAPAAFVLLLTLTVLAGVAPTEFSAPDRGAGPVLRTFGRVAPFLAAFAVAAAVGGAVHAAASRLVHDRGEDVLGALLGSVRLLASAGGAAVLHALVVAIAHGASVAIIAVLLRVLWDPIGIRLAGVGLDLPTAGLLVGFVAIWLCVILAAGALHAWGSATWSNLFTGRIVATGTDVERRTLGNPIDR